MFAVNKSSLGLLKSLVGKFIHGRTELLFCFYPFCDSQNAGYVILLSIMDDIYLSINIGFYNKKKLVTGLGALMDFITYLVTKIISIKSNIGDPTLEI